MNVSEPLPLSFTTNTVLLFLSDTIRSRDTPGQTGVCSVCKPIDRDGAKHLFCPPLSSDGDSSGEDSSSDYDWNDAINSLPSDDSDYENDSLLFNKNSLKQALLNLQHRMDSMTYGTYLADIEWSVSIEDLNTIATSISTNYY